MLPPELNRIQKSSMQPTPKQIFCRDNGFFPNSVLPVLFYQNAINLKFFFAGAFLRKTFEKNKWYNSWEGGILTVNHFHSNTHEVLGVCKGQTMLLLGGENGHHIKIQKGDVIVIPPRVAHRNLGLEASVKRIGAYPDGRAWDLKYGEASDRPESDKNIAMVPLPEKDPLTGGFEGLPEIWGRLSAR